MSPMPNFSNKTNDNDDELLPVSSPIPLIKSISIEKQMNGLDMGGDRLNENETYEKAETVSNAEKRSDKIPITRETSVDVLASKWR